MLPGYINIRGLSIPQFLLPDLPAPLTFDDHSAKVVRHDKNDSLLDGDLLNRSRGDTVGVV